MRRVSLTFPLILTFFGAGCGSDPVVEQPNETPGYKLGGTVSGLEGSGLELEVALDNALNSKLDLAANGAFTFAPTLADGATYSISVAKQPTGPDQNCQVSGGAGTIAGADVTSVAVDCKTLPLPGRLIGGNVAGLKGTGLVLQNNGADDLSLTADGPFQFVTKQIDGDMYNVSILTQPTNPAQTCTVANGQGTVNGADVETIGVSCVDDPLPPMKYAIGGTVVGLKGAGLVLQNNGADDLTITQDGTFAFAMQLDEGTNYDVTISVQPTNPQQLCVVTNGTGMASSMSPTAVAVKCGVDPSLVDVTNADRCDFLDSAHCLYPFPNDHFTVADPMTDTGRRLALNEMSMPVNQTVDLSAAAGAPPGTLVSPGGIPVTAVDMNWSDGFSPGQMVLTYVPNLDIAMSGIGQINHMERSLEADSPLVVIDAETGERHLVWGELDSFATSNATRSLIIRAGTNFREGHRYIVALRNLKNMAGEIIEPSVAFQVYRDGVASTIPEIEARRQHMESIFGTLAQAGIDRNTLYIAWDFTVASQRKLSSRMLHIRDDAFTKIGNAAPQFAITSVTQNPDANRSRRIQGTFTVPNYLNQAGGVSGSSFNYNMPNDGLPDQRNGTDTLQANFICNIPRAALPDGTMNTSPVVPGRAAIYGHGQQGNAGQVNGGSATGELSNLYNFVFCATDFIGMASSDDLNILQLVAQFGKMNTLADRLQQGLLNNLFLVRLMIHPQGFISDANFRGGPADQPLIDTSAAYYYGISQGGILGGAVVALSQDIRRGVLGVTGMNYSLLLDRATGFDQLRPFMDAAYPNEFERRLVFSTAQMLWDRGESNGYAWHMTTNPLPNTPTHEVLMQDAFADHQVTQWSADVEARTIGASIHTPTLNAGRSIDNSPYFAIPAIASYPFYGSAAFVWDTGPYDMATNKGTPPPPVENTALRAGVDPHGIPRVQPGARLQISEFLKPNGRIIDPCSGMPCLVP
ncbi:MAG TPA: hypothetical protein PK156_13105 [Polyangium sp.]|nr:hypothetical protein [Polyangium sp.]